MEQRWISSCGDVDWDELAHLYRIAPLGEPAAGELRTRFAHSQHVCFVYDGMTLVGAGRALADGNDCFYIADVAVHPGYQGRGIGKGIVSHLVGLSGEHLKVILYTVPGKEDFYRKLGFRRMKTALALFKHADAAAAAGIIE